MVKVRMERTLNGVHSVLLEFLSKKDEASLGVQEHRKLLKFVLTAFKKYLKNAMSIVKYNMPMNKALAISMLFGFV